MKPNIIACYTIIIILGSIAISVNANKNTQKQVSMTDYSQTANISNVIHYQNNKVKISENPKVTIIVPVYNVERYISQCLDSILFQSYKNIEVICINDGSTDNSLKILQDYAKKDNRIKILNKLNEGLSATKNVGLDKATGEYVMFVDSDDFVDPHYVEYPLRKMVDSQSDIVVFSAYNLQGDKLSPIQQHYALVQLIKERDSVHTNRRLIFNLYSYSCNKLYKREFIEKHSLRFIPRIKSSEDSIFNIECFFCKPKYAFLLDKLYYYRRDRLGSLTYSSIKGLRTDKHAFETFVHTPRFNQMDFELRTFVLRVIVNGVMHYKINSKNVIEDINILPIIREYIDFIKSNFTDKEIMSSQCKPVVEFLSNLSVMSCIMHRLVNFIYNKN